MQIYLNDKEIADIVKEHIMQTYRTKNVSVEYKIDLSPAYIKDSVTIHPAKINKLGVSVEVILQDSDYGNATSQMADAAISRIQHNLGRKHGNDFEPDLSPRLDSVGAPL